MTWVRRPRFGVWGGEPIGKVRTHLRRDLPQYVLADPRTHRRPMTEYTLQAILFDHMSWLLGRRWQIRVEDRIPTTELKADLVVERLTQHGMRDQVCGVIAVEVKPHGKTKPILADIRKLRRYIDLAGTTINAGLLFYLAAAQINRRAISRTVGAMDRKIRVVWLPKRYD